MSAELLARAHAHLDQDEAIAWQASYGLDLNRIPEWTAQLIDEQAPGCDEWRKRWAVVGGEHYIGAHTYEVTPRWADHIARHDPARVLRAVVAKRRACNLYEAALIQLREDEAAGYSSTDYARGVCNGLQRAVDAIVAEYEETT